MSTSQYGCALGGDIFVLWSVKLTDMKPVDVESQWHSPNVSGPKPHLVWSETLVLCRKSPSLNPYLMGSLGWLTNSFKDSPVSAHLPSV